MVKISVIMILVYALQALPLNFSLEGIHPTIMEPGSSFDPSTIVKPSKYSVGYNKGWSDAQELLCDCPDDSYGVIKPPGNIENPDDYLGGYNAGYKAAIKEHIDKATKLLKP